MLGWLFKKTEAQGVAAAFKGSRKKLAKIEGGAAAVCMSFFKHFSENSACKRYGFILKDDAPYEDHFIIYASLALLEFVNTLREDDENYELTSLLAEKSFLIANRIVNEEDFKKLMLGTTEELQEMLAARDEKAIAAWKAWADDPDLLKQVMAL